MPRTHRRQSRVRFNLPRRRNTAYSDTSFSSHIFATYGKIDVLDESYVADWLLTDGTLPARPYRMNVSELEDSDRDSMWRPPEMHAVTAFHVSLSICLLYQRTKPNLFPSYKSVPRSLVHCTPPRIQAAGSNANTLCTTAFSQHTANASVAVLPKLLSKIRVLIFADQDLIWFREYDQELTWNGEQALPYKHNSIHGLVYMGFIKKPNICKIRPTFLLSLSLLNARTLSDFSSSMPHTWRLSTSLT